MNKCDLTKIGNFTDTESRLGLPEAGYRERFPKRHKIYVEDDEKTSENNEGVNGLNVMESHT